MLVSVEILICARFLLFTLVIGLFYLFFYLFSSFLFSSFPFFCPYTPPPFQTDQNQTQNSSGLDMKATNTFLEQSEQMNHCKSILMLVMCLRVMEITFELQLIPPKIVFGLDVQFEVILWFWK